VYALHDAGADKPCQNINWSGFWSHLPGLTTLTRDGPAIGAEGGGAFGWPVAFLVSDAPGLLVAALTVCMAIKEPELGATDKLKHPCVEINDSIHDQRQHF
jgi:hypothetical protein